MAYEGKSVVDMLEHWAQVNPEKPAFIFVDASMEERTVLSRGQMWDYARKYAAMIRAMGIAKGDVVCNTLANSPHRIISDMGAITSGCIAMSGQIGMADGQDFVSSLNKTNCTALVLDSDETNNSLAVLKPKFESYNKTTGKVVCPDVPSLKFIIDIPLSTKESREAFFNSLDLQNQMIHEKISPSDICQYVNTSGSTDFFKILAYDSIALLDFGKRNADALGCLESDKYLSDRQLGYLLGFPNIYLVVGLTQVMLNEAGRRAQNGYTKCWQIGKEENCDVAFAAPYLLSAFCEFVKNCEDDALKGFRFRTIATGGGPTRRNKVEMALHLLCDTLSIQYGSSECGLITNLSVSNINEYEDFNTGYPAKGIEVKVVDANAKDVLVGEASGEILTRSQLRSVGYVNDQAATDKTFQKDGWIRLGDVGKRNKKGQIFIFGRDNFSIIRGTFSMYPEPYEYMLRETNGVKDVVAVGVPDELMNEEWCVFVILETGVQLTEYELMIRFERQLADKTQLIPPPKYINFVDSFPLNVNGKLDRSALKTKAYQILGIQT